MEEGHAPEDAGGAVMKMEKKDMVAAQRMFSRYYSGVEISVPMLERREFGYGIEDKIDSRHLCFLSERDFKSFLCNTAPLYVSHSAAYYERPGAYPMEKKGWKGADLVFDLDLEPKGRFPTVAEIAKCGEDALRLIEELIVPDFGVSKSEITSNFSGNRGYHVHVRSPGLAMLRGEERRQIIEYVKGIGLDYNAFFSVKEIPLASGKVAKREEGPVPSNAGYPGRFAKKVLAALDSAPERFGRYIKDKNRLQVFRSDVLSGNWSMRNSSTGISKRLAELAAELSLRTVNIDSGVTLDTAKLIRVPNTLHGSTGLCARSVAVSDLATYNPFTSALALPEAEMRVFLIEDIQEMEFKGRAIPPMQKNEIKTLPAFHAMYLVLKGAAKIA
jgi:DNA primase small subunit